MKMPNKQNREAPHKDHEETESPGHDDSRIWVTDFTTESARTFASQVLDRAEGNPSVPIMVYIDSYGGEVDALATMVSVMDSVPNPVVTVAMGKAMSCGAMLLAHGNIRCIAPHARVMIHEVTAGAHGNINDMLADAKEYERVNEYWMNILALDCKQDPAKFRELFSNSRREMYFTAQAAVDFGLADKVGLPVVQQQMVVEYQVAFFEDVPRPELVSQTSEEPAPPPKKTKKSKPAKRSRK